MTRDTDQILKFIVVKNLIFPDFLGEYTSVIHQIKILLHLNFYKIPYRQPTATRRH